MQMNLRKIRLSERSKNQKAIFLLCNHLHEIFRVGKSMETKCRLEVARGRMRRRKWGKPA